MCNLLQDAQQKIHEGVFGGGGGNRGTHWHNAVHILYKGFSKLQTKLFCQVLDEHLRIKDCYNRREEDGG